MSQSDQDTKIHQVLARKYRPQKFQDVVEQQTAVRALQNAVQNERLGSAYLFFGPRGVGKTTIARLIAKRVNCESPVGNEPCDQCDSCRAILEGNSLDVIEIDAASHRGIQNIRELRENVKFQPMMSKKKVYIIDEVHMLTMESFNALLKTLEEPPEHVLFVLATTEYNKIPETILSRCQVFIFRKVPLKTVQKHLAAICDSEGMKYEDEALFWIARRGDGSVRDSMSFLELAMTFSEGEITTERIKELMGADWLDVFISLSLSVLDENSRAEEVMKPVHDIFQEGGDLNRFIWEYMDFLRIAIHIRQGIEDTEFLGLPGGDIHKIRDAFVEVDSVKLSIIFESIYNLLTRSMSLRLRNSYETRVLIEMELYNLRERLNRPSLSGILTRISKLSEAVGREESYSPENDLQSRFLGTIVDPTGAPPPDARDGDELG